MASTGLSRRGFLHLAGGAFAAAGIASTETAYADPASDNQQWVTNTDAIKLVGADDLPIVSLPAQTPMRVARLLATGQMDVWVPRYGLYGLVTPSNVRSMSAPSPQDLAGQAPVGPLVLEGVGLPGRAIGGANLRSWPAVRDDTVLRVVPHNGPLHVLERVEGDAGDEWYNVNVLDAANENTVATGFILSSLVRVPRLRDQTVNPDRGDNRGRHFQADLQEPAMLAAFENGSPVWATLALKGTDANATPLGAHRIFARVANETMTSERVVPPIPRNAPGGYYLEGVLYTQYFTDDGASIHYNYWSSNWGYAGTHGCLGIGLNEAKFAWDFGAIGIPVYIFD